MRVVVEGNGRRRKHRGGAWSEVSAKPPQYTQRCFPNKGDFGNDSRVSIESVYALSKANFAIIRAFRCGKHGKVEAVWPASNGAMEDDLER